MPERMDPAEAEQTLRDYAAEPDDYATEPGELAYAAETVLAALDAARAALDAARAEVERPRTQRQAVLNRHLEQQVDEILGVPVTECCVCVGETWPCSTVRDLEGE